MEYEEAQIIAVNLVRNKAEDDIKTIIDEVRNLILEYENIRIPATINDTEIENTNILNSLSLLLKHSRNTNDITAITDCVKLFEIKEKNNSKLRFITNDIYNEIYYKSNEFLMYSNND